MFTSMICWGIYAYDHFVVYWRIWMKHIFQYLLNIVNLRVILLYFFPLCTYHNPLSRVPAIGAVRDHVEVQLLYRLFLNHFYRRVNFINFSCNIILKSLCSVYILVSQINYINDLCLTQCRIYDGLQKNTIRKNVYP